MKANGSMREVWKPGSLPAVGTKVLIEWGPKTQQNIIALRISEGNNHSQYHRMSCMAQATEILEVIVPART
jgi:hypothetical protein